MESETGCPLWRGEEDAANLVRVLSSWCRSAADPTRWQSSTGVEEVQAPSLPALQFGLAHVSLARQLHLVLYGRQSLPESA